MTEEGSAENNDETAPRPVGEQLRAAREYRDMDRQDVADQLHLRPSIIAAIEESDYETMPADLFLKGYVRSYARLTDQDGDDLIARLDEELEPFRQEREKESEPSPTDVIRQKKLRRRRIGGAVITGVALLVLGWLIYQYGPWVVDSAGEVVEAVGEVELDVPEASSAGDEGSEVELEPETVGAGESTSEPEPEAETETEESPGSASTGSEPTPDSPEPVALVEEPEADEPSAPSSLVITFDGACWVEVVNGNDERVVTTLAQEGDSVEYEGPGPFEVLLGNVDAVSGMRFMGNTVDLEQYPANAGRTQFVLEAANG